MKPVQDAQEFSKLFMALLEKDPEMRQLIQQQFMGKYEYLTWSVTDCTYTAFVQFSVFVSNMSKFYSISV